MVMTAAANKNAAPQPGDLAREVDQHMRVSFERLSFDARIKGYRRALELEPMRKCLQVMARLRAAKGDANE